METPKRPLRPELESIIPIRMRARPVDQRGYCVPWFVLRTGFDTWDFRIVQPRKILQAINQRICWLCGESLSLTAMGEYIGDSMTFVIGPMCVVNRTTSEPPCHRECAEFAVRACPFLSLPKAQYRDANLPEGCTEPAGMGLMHNPTVCVTWTTRGFTIQPASNGGVLFRLFTEPDRVQFWHKGQLATRRQVCEGMLIGLPHIYAVAEREGELPEFRRYFQDALRFLPAAAPGEEHDPPDFLSLLE